jgi:hypothetical protein
MARKEQEHGRESFASPSLFYKLVFFLLFTYVLIQLLSYSRCWVHPEHVELFLPKVLENGAALRLEDWLSAFEIKRFESFAPRIRFLSNLFYVLNIKLRVWLWNYIPPHPTFSLTWIFSLLLSPVLLYRLIRRMTGERSSAWVGLALYVTSWGFLSNILLLFHPGKPLACFFTILCLYLASSVVSYARRREEYARRRGRRLFLLPVAAGGGLPPPGPERFAYYRRILGYQERNARIAAREEYYTRRMTLCFSLLLGLILLAAFADEFAWFIFLAVPVLFPSIFFVERWRAAFRFWYLAAFLAFLALLTFLAPLLAGSFGFQGFDFWQYLRTHIQTGGEFRWGNAIAQGRNFLSGDLGLPHPNLPAVRLAWALICGYGAVLFAFLPAERKKTALRAWAAVFLCTLYITTVLTKHLVVVRNSWYYGAVFPIFLALAVAVLFSERPRALRIPNALAFLVLAAVWAGRIHGLDRSTLSFATVLEAWRTRDDPDMLRRRIEESLIRRPTDYSWLLYELFPSATKADRIPPNLRESNLLVLPEAKVTAASATDPEHVAANLADGDPTTIWHVAMDKIGEPTWVTVDFGEGRGKTVRRAAAIPRPGLSWQFFRHAVLLGSNDGVEWEEIAPLNQNEQPQEGDGCSWTFPNWRSFRLYKVLIRSGQQQHFHSMGELALYE